jgi:hypothetical protein
MAAPSPKVPAWTASAAEECFFLAAVAKDPAAAAELVKTGDDYLRCAAGWLADQLRT